MATLAARITDVVGAIRDKLNTMTPRLLPAGGLSGQSLTKTSSTNYATGWATIVSATRGLSTFCAGKPANDEIIGGGIAPYALTLVQASCKAKAKVAFTGTTTFIIRREGTQIGTIVFAAAATTGTVTITSSAISIDDYVSIHGPASADATGADISVLLIGT